MVRNDSQLLKGVLPLLLLSILANEEDYGYSIVVRLQDLGFESLAEGTVYPALSRMESKGLLTSRLVKSESGPARKYYRPTNDGAAELAAASIAWEELVNNVDRVKQATTQEQKAKS